MKKAPFQGGFSDEVYCHPHFQAYIASADSNRAKYGVALVFGYIGSRDRTSARDRIVEARLRLKYRRLANVVAWLTSSDGRHMMDTPTRRTTTREFQTLAQKWIG